MYLLWKTGVKDHNNRRFIDVQDQRRGRLGGKGDEIERVKEEGEEQEVQRALLPIVEELSEWRSPPLQQPSMQTQTDPARRNKEGRQRGGWKKWRETRVKAEISHEFVCGDQWCWREDDRGRSTVPKWTLTKQTLGHLSFSVQNHHHRSVTTHWTLTAGLFHEMRSKFREPELSLYWRRATQHHSIVIEG